MRTLLALLLLISPLNAQWEESATLKKVQGHHIVTHSTESWFQKGFTENVKSYWMWEDLDGDGEEDYIYSLELKKEGRMWTVAMTMTSSITEGQGLIWGETVKKGNIFVTEMGFTVMWESGKTTTFIKTSKLKQ